MAICEEAQKLKKLFLYIIMLLVISKLLNHQSKIIFSLQHIDAI